MLSYGEGLSKTNDKHAISEVTATIYEELYYQLSQGACFTETASVWLSCIDGWKTKESVGATDTLCSNANECLPSGSLQFFKLILLKMKCVIFELMALKPGEIQKIPTCILASRRADFDVLRHKVDYSHWLEILKEKSTWEGVENWKLKRQRCKLFLLERRRGNWSLIRPLWYVVFSDIFEK